MENEIQKTKTRILCLHGFRTSGIILQKLVERWPQPLLEKLDLVFMDAPFPSRGKSDVDGIFDPPFYEWFHSDEEFKEFYNFEECLAKIQEFMLNNGPFDGVLGFSQLNLYKSEKIVKLQNNVCIGRPNIEYYKVYTKGAILSAAIPGMQREGVALTEVPKVKFVIIISGAKFGGSRFGMPKLAAASFSTPVVTPSLHLIGEMDFMKEESIGLVESFIDPIVIHHPKGHTIPRLDEKTLDIFCNFIAKIQDSE